MGCVLKKNDKMKEKKGEYENKLRVHSMRKQVS